MRIVSWNIQWCRGADGVVDPVRIVFALRDIGDIDLICLQEVAQCFPGLKGGACEDEVGIFAAAFPHHEVLFAPALDIPDGQGGRARFGNMLISRLPVGQAVMHALPFPADPEYPAMQRVCLETVVDAPWGAVRLMNTHLEYYSPRQRAAQIAALCVLQQQAADLARQPPKLKTPGSTLDVPPRPVSAIVCGDFNCRPMSREYETMLEFGWQDAWRLAHGDLPHAPSVGLHGAEWPGERYCCDFAFVTPDLAERVRGVSIDERPAASDHQPLVLDMD